MTHGSISRRWPVEPSLEAPSKRCRNQPEIDSICPAGQLCFAPSGRNRITRTSRCIETRENTLIYELSTRGIEFISLPPGKWISNAGILGLFGFLAEREGFEPSVRLPVRSLSKGVLSTTQPPFRVARREL